VRNLGVEAVVKCGGIVDLAENYLEYIIAVTIFSWRKRLHGPRDK
jgi:hypothetical protein